MKILRSLIILMGVLMVTENLDAAKAAEPENTLVLEVEDGTVLIEMLPEVAPKHVARIKELVRQGFYDGLLFHRVIDGFMAQTGDPKGDGTGGSGKKIEAEFSNEPFERGTVGMARSQSPNSGDSQFFICLDEANFLNGQYTVWGRVIDGMEAVDGIKKAPAGRSSGTVDDPDRIISLKVQSDL